MKLRGEFIPVIYVYVGIYLGNPTIQVLSYHRSSTQLLYAMLCHALLC